MISILVRSPTSILLIVLRTLACMHAREARRRAKLSTEIFNEVYGSLLMIGWATVDDGSEEDELGSILLLSTSIVKEESAFFSLLIPVN